MLVMEQIETIKELQFRGLSPSEIARKLSVDWKTVVKYMQQECYSPKPPSVRCAESKLDPWKPVIDGWLDEDRKVRYKQRHTAKRVFDRLYEECPGFTGSYPIVQRYVKQVRGSQETNRWFSGTDLATRRSTGRFWRSRLRLTGGTESPQISLHVLPPQQWRAVPGIRR